MAVRRREEDARSPDPDSTDELARADVREAYERGRRDERAQRRRHPLGMTVTFVLAAVGLIILGLAALNGSFGRAGQMVDRGLSAAVSRAQAPAPEAASNKIRRFAPKATQSSRS